MTRARQGRADMSKLLSLGRLFGIDAVGLIRSTAALPGLIRDYLTFKRLLLQENDFRLGKPYPCLGEDREKSGLATGHDFGRKVLGWAQHAGSC